TTLRSDLRGIGLYTGTVVSKDEKSASIMVGTPHGRNRIELYREICDIIATKQPAPEEFHVIGAPVAEALLGTHLLEDLGVPAVLLGHRGKMDVGAPTHAPRSLDELRLWIGQHIGLVPIAISIMAVVFLLSFRSAAAVALPLSEVAAAILFVFALMGWCGVPVYLTTAVLPVILTAIGVADEIHIFARYQDLLGEDLLREDLRRDDPSRQDSIDESPQTDHRVILEAAMGEMWVPVVKTSVTTAVGFLSFALSPIGPVRAFGVFTAIGVLFCMAWSLTVVPALLALMNPQRFAGRRADPDRAATGGAGLFARLARLTVRGRFVVVVLAVIVVVIAPQGVRRIEVQDSWIDGFAPSSEFYQATRAFNEDFLGMHVLLITVDMGHTMIAGELGKSAVDHHTLRLPASMVPDPSALVGWFLEMEMVPDRRNVGRGNPKHRGAHRRSTWIEAVEVQDDTVLITLPKRAGSPKLALHSARASKLTYEITPRRLQNPEDLRRLAKLTDFIESLSAYAVGGAIGPADYVATTNLMSRGLKQEERRIPDTRARIRWLWSQYERIRGHERARQIVDKNYARTVITAFLEDANFIDTAELMSAIREYEREHLSPHGITLDFAGDVAVSQTLIDAIVTTQIRSLLISLVGILVVAGVLSRSLVFGMLSVLPCALAVLMNFAFMGWSGMPLGVATSMFAGMTLGIGVDFAIHLLERYRRAVSRGLDVDAAIADALCATGPAIVIDAIAVALGFGILTLSQVPANARLGGLVVVSIAGCLAATLLVLPALLRLLRPGYPRVATPH
ncbi:MAG: MMPL family transporter, partial [Planctomycetes bacterium]|nr:MMPL family transporter [Planctomycetota bacterium]